MTRDPNAAIRADLRRRISQCQNPDADYRDQARLGAFVVRDGPALLDEIDAQRRWINRHTADRPFCYRCEVLDDAGAGNCRCEIAANE